MIALYALAAVTGACLGSFASTAAVRLARGEQAIVGRSRCDGCGQTLGFLATVPVISYVGRAGACSACRGRIDPVHPIGEIAGAAIAVAAFAAAPVPQALLISALGLLLLASAILDARTQHLPDFLTAAAALIAAALAWTHGAVALTEGLIAAAVAFLVMEGVRRSFLWLRRKPGLGFGDVKLLAALAPWLGVATPWAVVGASVLGLLTFAVLRPKDGRIAFGPMLILAGLIVGLLREAHAWPQP